MKSILFAILLIVSAAIYLFFAIRSIPINKWVKLTAKRRIIASLFYTMPFIFVILFSWALFPENIVMKTGVVGIYNHFSGFLFGIIVAFNVYEHLGKHEFKKRIRDVKYG